MASSASSRPTSSAIASSPRRLASSGRSGAVASVSTLKQRDSYLYLGSSIWDKTKATNQQARGFTAYSIVHGPLRRPFPCLALRLLIEPEGVATSALPDWYSARSPRLQAFA